MLKKLIQITALMWVFAGFGFKLSMAGTYTLFPVEDAHVASYAPFSNFGGTAYLSVSGEKDPSYGYLKFHLGDIPLTERIVDAKLTLFSFYGYKATCDLHHITGDSWQENLVVWNNRPDADKTAPLLSSAYIPHSDTAATWNLFDTGAWNPDFDQGDKYLTLMLKPRKKPIFFSSRTAGADLSPFIEIRTELIPTVTFTPDPAEVFSPFTVTYNVTSTGTIEQWYWEFGDGSVSNEKTPVHTFEKPGVYTTRVTVTGPGGSASFSGVVNCKNSPPEADAGAAQFIDENVEMVFLSGAGSSDRDGDSLSYSWMQKDGIPVEISNPGSSQAGFVPPDVGVEGASLTFQLLVDDGFGGQDTDTCIVTISFVNTPPVCDSGDDIEVTEGDKVCLDGSNSTDPDDGIYSYLWEDTCEDSTVELEQSDTPYPCFTAPSVGQEGGTLKLRLTVTDQGQLKDSDEIIITVAAKDIPPVCDAGEDLEIREDAEIVILSGSGSSDLPGEELTYSWAQKSGTIVELKDADTPNAFFTPPDVGVDGDTLVFELTVTDTGGLTVSDNCTVNISYLNTPPLGDAGKVQEADAGEMVYLDGSGSIDTDDGIISYSWEQVEGDTIVALSGEDTAFPSFKAPDFIPVDDVLSFQLTVKDKGGLTATDEVEVHLNRNYFPPACDAGGDQDIYDDVKKVVLSGSGTCDEDETISFAWTQTGGPNVMLKNKYTKIASFSPMDVGVDGVILTFLLTVTDSRGEKAEDTCVVNISHRNEPPVSRAGEDIWALEGESVTLDGSASTDIDDGIESFLWEQTGGVTLVSLSGEETAIPSFKVPDNLAADDVLTFQLTVKDRGGLVDTDQVLVHIKNSYIPPSCDAGEDQSVFDDAVKVTLSGSGTCDKDETISFAWIQTGGPGVMLKNKYTKDASFTPMDVGVSGESLTFLLTVSDSRGGKAEDSCEVNISHRNVPPVSRAGEDLWAAAGEKVSLDGTASTDIDDGIKSFLWEQVGGDASVALSGSGTVTSEFTAPAVKPGGESLVFKLTVTDKGGLENSDEVVVHVMGNAVPDLYCDAGEDRQVGEDEDVIFLSGSVNGDSHGGSFSCEWTQAGGTPVKIMNESEMEAYFFPPDVGPEGEVLTFMFTVRDGMGNVAVDSCMVTVSFVNTPPETSAGEDRNAHEGDVVYLDGSASRDIDDGIAGYHWKQTGGSTMVLIFGRYTDSPHFTAPLTDEEGDILTFQLTVTDHGGLQSTDEVKVHVSMANRPPVSDSGDDQIAWEGNTVYLNGSGSSDPEEKPLTYEWTQVDGLPVVFSDPGAANPHFITPPVKEWAEKLVFELKVTDDEGLSDVSTNVVIILDNKITVIPDDFLSFFSFNGRPMGIRCDAPGQLLRLETINPDEITDQSGRPSVFPYGMIDISIKVENPGDVAMVSYYLPDPVPEEHLWMKWDNAYGWTDYSVHTWFEQNGHIVNLMLVDGGFGDSDGVANGVIADPSGLASFVEDDESEDTDSSDNTDNAGVDADDGDNLYDLMFIPDYARDGGSENAEPESNVENEDPGSSDSNGEQNIVQDSSGAGEQMDSGTNADGLDFESGDIPFVAHRNIQSSSKAASSVFTPDRPVTNKFQTSGSYKEAGPAETGKKGSVLKKGNNLFKKKLFSPSLVGMGNKGLIKESITPAQKASIASLGSTSSSSGSPLLKILRAAAIFLFFLLIAVFLHNSKAFRKYVRLPGKGK